LFGFVELNSNISYSVSATKERFADDKIKETNMSRVDAEIISDDWKMQELNIFFRDLRMKSFREGQQSFDKCLQIGKYVNYD